MDVRWISAGRVEEVPVEDLKEVLSRPEGWVWVDVPAGDPDAERILADVFEFHPMAVRNAVERNPVPKVHVYADHVFVVVHAPQEGQSGHVHYVELDQFVGPRYLVTVHGPANEAVDAAAMHVETDAVRKRLEAGRLRPPSPAALSSAVVTALATRMRDYIVTVTEQVWQLEQRVTAGHHGDAEHFLDELFRARHGLLVIRTMAALSREVYGRMVALTAFGAESQPLVADSVDQFSRICTMAEGQKDYLQGVIEFYQARTNTKISIAAERLAVIAAITLPVTALSSILGMNVIVNGETQYTLLIATLTAMAVISAMLLVWTKRKGWW